MSIKSYQIQGKALYAKIIGEPVPGYEPELREWTFDLVLDEANEQKLLDSGASPQYIKQNKATGEPYVRFTRKEIKRDGSKGSPINIVDSKNNPWGNELIGNGSTLNVQYTLNTVGRGKDVRNKPSVLAVQVWDYVRYIPPSTFPSKEEAPHEEGSW